MSLVHIQLAAVKVSRYEVINKITKFSLYINVLSERRVGLHQLSHGVASVVNSR